jgi:hypothetical protein
MGRSEVDGVQIHLLLNTPTNGIVLRSEWRKR